MRKLTPSKLSKAQPWKLWIFVFGLNLLAWIGWYFLHDAPSKW